MATHTSDPARQPTSDDRAASDRPMHERFADALRAFEDTGTDDDLIALYADDCRIGNIVTGERHRGPDGAAEFWSSYRNQFERIESRFTLMAGDDSGAVLEWESAGSANGDDVSYRGATVLEYDGDAIIRSMAYFDPRAVGRQLVDAAEVSRPS